MIKTILTDIEGTTSSLSFVKDVLFPYSRERMADFVRRHGQESAVRLLLDEVARLAGVNHTDDNRIVEQLVRWIDEDRKIASLKALQGMIWESGYRHGDFKGHVYEDAVRNLRRWQARGIRLYVYSSGSVHAQKLLFGHTEYGDLTPLFSGYFDTATGGKREVASYQKIAGIIGTPPGEILFLSDIKEELDAARQAGMRTAWLVRDDCVDGVAPHPQAIDFDGISMSGIS